MVQMASLPTPHLTEEEYLRIERAAETKSEFHDGQMFAMAGGSLDHSVIGVNVCAILRGQAPSGCRTFSSDLRIRIISAGLYTYADGGVICGDPQFEGDRSDIILNPLLIAEVLSPSTEGYDRGKKFELYRTIDSFKEYLIVHQDRYHVEHYSKQDDGSWLLREYTGPEASVAVTRLNVRISLADLYESALDLS